MKTRIPWLASGVLVIAASAVLAEQALKPGQWEMTRTTNDPALNARAAEMRARMEKMPPEQRKRMEALLGGSSPGADGATVMKTCITPEQVATFEAHTNDQARCTREVFEKNGSQVHIRSRCQGGMVMDVKATYQGDRSYESVITATLPGRPAPMVTHVKARWLGPTCGKDDR